MVRDSNDSLGSFLPDQDSNFQTPIKSKQTTKVNTSHNKQTYSLASNDNYDDDNDNDLREDFEEKSRLLQIEQTKLQNERKQFESEKKQFEIEKKQVQSEKKQVEANQIQYEQEKKVLEIEKKNIQKLREKIEQEKLNTNDSFSPTKLKELNHQDLQYEEKYNKLMKEYEDIRRENISLQVEIEKGKKTLEHEKNVSIIEFIFIH